MIIENFMIAAIIRQLNGLIIIKTGTAEWERARLYRVNRPPLDHVRQKKSENNA